ncbi:TPA: SIMPL domain-containing protein [Candidatus Nomurabacteria bacterium]|nr:MAG: hypothetical protein O210_OD1C00001G0026 [Parcubacteria bacterium RAAC4_OD1_1]HCY26542.1 SIMPL domain-containing protein [Candidatus Nomurabacteria bacterium]
MENTTNNIINSKKFLGIAIIIFAVLLSVAFFFAAMGFSKQGSYVEVKGLSERIVKADTAIWSMTFEVKSNNVEQMYSEIEKNITAIKTFLKSKGFEDSEINIAPANIYQDTYGNANFRYNANNQISVYTKKVDLAKITSADTLPLMKSGVVLNQSNVSFELSDINSIKPEMLAEAVENAKNTANQFAENSLSSVGKVSRGNQGVFDITEKDPGSPEYKKIRLVSTLRFLLK